MQKIPITAITQSKEPNKNNLTFKNQGIMHPKPPNIPRSQSSKDLQLTRKQSTPLQNGRRLVLHRSYSTPNVGYCEDLKLPKTTRNSLLGKGKRNYDVNKQKMDNIFKGRGYLEIERSGTVNDKLSCKEPQAITGNLKASKNDFNGQLTRGNYYKQQTYNNLNSKTCSVCTSILCSSNCITKEQYCSHCNESACKDLKQTNYYDMAKCQTVRGKTKGSQICKGLKDLSYEYKRNNVLNGFRSCSVFEANAEIGPQELPCVSTKQQISLSASETAKHICAKPIEMHAKSSEWLTEPVGFYTDVMMDLRQNSFRPNDCEVVKTNQHAVFFIDHDDGRLQAASNLKPVAEEPGRQHSPESPWRCYNNDGDVSPNRLSKLTNHDPQSNIAQLSPWQCHSNESKVVLNELRESTNQEAGCMMLKSPWQCCGDNMIDDMFDSDDEGGLVIKPHYEESGLDVDKRAMIDSWIRDVTLNTSTPNV